MVIGPGLAISVGLAVTVWTGLPMLARLVALAGLISGLSSDGSGCGLAMAFVAAAIPSLRAVVATGASSVLLIPYPALPIGAVRGLYLWFSVIGGGWRLCISLSARWPSATGGAVGGGTAETPGLNAPFNRGDFDDGESARAVWVVADWSARSCEWSVRLRFREFDLPVSGSGSDAVVVKGKAEGLGRITAVVGAAERGPCSEAMGVDVKGFVGTQRWVAIAVMASNEILDTLGCIHKLISSPLFVRRLAEGGGRAIPYK